MPGLTLTQVGYTGGTTSYPTYYRLGDHTEVVRLFYDPAVTSLAKILETFFRCHDSAARRPSQYRSLIVCTTEEQRETAGIILGNRRGRTLTVIEEDRGFHLAEEKHQKYQFKRHPALVRSFAWEPSPADSFVISRLNGFLGSQGKMATFNQEWQRLGLSKEIAEYVRAVIVGRC